MLLGFISLLQTVGTSWVSRICITAKAGGLMLPCRKDQKYTNSDDEGKDDRRRLLWYGEQHQMWCRSLAAAAVGDNHCSSHGDMVLLITQKALHQLHLFIFVLAVFHVFYSVITMALGQAKMNKWKQWELETNSLEYQFSNDPSRFRLVHQTSFVRRHVGLSSTPGIRWIVAFFRQFFRSVTKVDYLTMRRGFITAHLSPNSKFNFHKYIKRSLQDNFKVVVGISYPLWIFAVIFMLLNVYGWYTLFWISFVPIIMGSNMKKAIFEGQTAKALKRWQKGAKERSKLRKAGIDISSTALSGENTPSHGTSPLHLLHKSKFRSTDIESVITSPRSYFTSLRSFPSLHRSYPGSPRSYQSENDIADNMSPLIGQVPSKVDSSTSIRDGEHNSSTEFSFARS